MTDSPKLSVNSEYLGVDPVRAKELLAAWAQGDPNAREDLVALLYPRLRQLARQARRGESAGRTLRTTGLVHEAYIRLVDANVDWANTRHFLRVAARVMRRVLVDQARARKRDKRGGADQPVPFDVVVDEIGAPSQPDEFLGLNDAVEELLELDERKGTAVELLYFGGLSYDEIAKVLELSTATVHRELRAARAWLRTALADRR